MSEITINLHDIPCGNCTVCIGRSIGAKHEQERIIRLLEENAKALSQIETGHGKGSEIMSIRTKTIENTIALIKGEK